MAGELAKRLYGPQLLGTSNAVLYTVPANTLTIVRLIHVANGGATVYTFNVAINGTAATIANHFLSTINVGPSTAFSWSGFLPLAAGDTIQALGSNAANLPITISGIEVT